MTGRRKTELSRAQRPSPMTIRGVKKRTVTKKTAKWMTKTVIVQNSPDPAQTTQFTSLFFLSDREANPAYDGSLSVYLGNI